MQTIVPLGVRDPKSRLAGVFDPRERAGFAAAMLGDVLSAVRAAGGEPTVLADAPLDGGAADGAREPGVEGGGPVRVTADVDCPVVVDDRPLTDAVGDAVAARLAVDAEPAASANDTGRVAVVMADLAIATPSAVETLHAAGRAADVAVAPGLGGGTNAVVVGAPGFTFDYHGASVRDHRRRAADAGLSTREVDSFRLAVDVDVPADLAEVLLHGEGRAADWLREAGVRLTTDGGRVGIRRED